MSMAQEKSFRLCVFVILCSALALVGCDDDTEPPTGPGSYQNLSVNAELWYFGVVLNWNNLDRDYCAAYLLQRSDSPDGELQTIDTLDAFKSVHVDRSLIANNTFRYRLVALDYSRQPVVYSNIDTVDILGSCMCLSDTVCLLAAAGGESIPINVLNSSIPASFPFTVSENISWLTLTASTGFAPNGFSVSAEANNDAENRFGSVIVSAEGIGDSPETLLVAQAIVGGILCPTQDELNAPPLGGSNVEVEIQSCAGIPSCRWIAESDADWLTIQTDTGTSPAGLVLLSGVNYSDGARSCVVTVRPDGYDEPPDTIDIIQGRPFGSPDEYSFSGTPSSICCADLDGDGDADLAVASDDQAYVVIFRNNGDGTFAAAETHATSGGTKWIRPADLDNDGDIDLAAVYADGQTICVLKNAGNGTFTGTDLGLTENLGRLSVADCEFDGDIDLVSVNRSTNEAVVIVNNGDATFSQVVRKRVGGGPADVCAANFNKTGNLDLATCNSLTDNVSMLINSLLLTYANATNFLVQDNPVSLCTEDFNGDTRYDLAVVCNGVDRVYLLTNTGKTGTGRFTAGGTLEVVDDPVSICASDLDADGDKDLLVAGYGISVLVNQGAGVFSAPLNLGSGAEWMVDVCSGDFDGDGDLDIAAANQTSGVATVFINNSR